MKTFLLLLVGVVIGAFGLYAYQDPGVRYDVSQFIKGIGDLAFDADAPTPTTTSLAVAALSPTAAIPATHTPAPTATQTQIPTASPTSVPTPIPIPIATAVRVLVPTPRPAAYSVEVVSAKSLDDRQVDFVLNVANIGGLDTEGASEVRMSVDGGPPELVNIIGSLSPGESSSFAFIRALDPGRRVLTFMVGDFTTAVSVNIESEDGGVLALAPTPTIMPTPEPTPTLVQTYTPTRTPTPAPTYTPVPTPMPVPPTPRPAPDSGSPSLRHIEEKRYMLELINIERENSGLNSVVLGDNAAAQLHAEAALENCFAGHWGVDGLKPYMRYSLAGGYQPNGENGRGSDYCIKASDRYTALGSIESEIQEAISGWMSSPGHRRNILDKWHKKVNIGLAWDKYNILAYQHFEGDYVEYDQLPNISEDGVLTIEGVTKNGAGFSRDRELGVQIYYDPPTHALTRGQVTRTYCYDNGLQIASLRWPLTGRSYWIEDEYLTTYSPCPDPYDVSADAPGPRSHDEAHRFWQEAYAASRANPDIPITVPWITALEWTVNREGFSVRADLSDLLAEHGDGVYTIMVWDDIGGEDAVISQYSIFYGVTPPDTYYR